MKDWPAIGLGAAGTLGTIAVKDVSGWFALGCGALTFVLLARKCLLTFRNDFRAWRSARDRRPFPVVKSSQDRKSGPENL